ncbi:hypothetical protein CY34DRAFT_800972 [Suillus luteus UH-Slu-Lm8-n1]|uniref:Uncharacterized protein n=1 Tax=Suillus luteus UH-Slu-Lm8-n1 TaxID=930992 RepID=A0A0D0A795_9AGAM|nr:hypothetical protein CY34DRAFT_800972 [Suillus luteus UH-Slu-Lm8-n1]
MPQGRGDYNMVHQRPSIAGVSLFCLFRVETRRGTPKSERCTLNQCLCARVVVGSHPESDLGSTVVLRLCQVL